MEEKKVIFPEELEGIVEKNSVNVLFQGQIYENLSSPDKKRYQIYKSINVRDTIPLTPASKKYIKQRNLKDKDKIVFVEYDLNGKQMFDVFKAE